MDNLKDNQIMITEDQALSMNTTIEEYLQEYINDDFTVAYKYDHPAVGKVIVLNKPTKEDQTAGV